LLQTDKLWYFLCALYLGLGIGLAFMSYWRNANVLNRVTLIALGLLVFAPGIAFPLVECGFFNGAGFFGRSTSCFSSSFSAPYPLSGVM
jgi:hypothetical protein